MRLTLARLTLARLTLAFAIPLLALGGAAARAADPLTFNLVIKDHRFTPDRIEAPANTKLLLIIRNQDATPEEFEMPDLHRERIISPGQEIRFPIGGLPVGDYPYIGEFHDSTAKGVLVVK